MDEDREIIKDNKDNGNKLNISNKRAELSYSRGEDLVRDITYRQWNPATESAGGQD